MQYIKNLLDVQDRYDGFLWDAYGVLYDGRGLVDGAVKAWRALESKGKLCYILTNGSSRTLAETAAMYEQLGLTVPTDRIINSASLLQGYFSEYKLEGTRTAVLGTKGSATYVTESGGIPVDPLSTDDYAAIVVANQTDYPLLDTLEQVLSTVITRVENNLPVKLILTNPDLIYPHATRRFGITAGSIALLLEAALEARLGPKTPRFDKLGKPYTRIYNEAFKRAGTRRLLMIGDQLETDIRGAQNAGIDSLLVGTGLIDVSAWQPAATDPRPTYVLADWKDP